MIPLIGGIFSFGTHANKKAAPVIFTLFTAGLLALTLLALTVFNNPSGFQFTAPWLSSLGSSFSLLFDPLAMVLCLLTALVYFLLALYMSGKSVQKPAAFYGWLLLAQSGMMGVFLSTDGLLFYFCWGAGPHPHVFFEFYLGWCASHCGYL
ncbi:MAG: hypothetical protein ACKOD1_04455 [Sphingomonadales bacterium]